LKLKGFAPDRLPNCPHGERKVIVFDGNIGPPARIWNNGSIVRLMG
jgi:hypothetical protein